VEYRPVQAAKTAVVPDFAYLCTRKRMKKRIHHTLDFLYPLFSRFMDRTTFRYAASGGSNTLLDILLFFISYNFIFRKQPVHLGFVTMTPHVAAFLFSFLFTFPIGFLLMRNIVFTESNLKGRIQLFRYFMVVLLCFFLNYVFLKFFVEQLHIYPTPAKILTTCIVIGVSYLSQKYFTFRVSSTD
jgi:putative flippase GtrA